LVSGLAKLVPVWLASRRSVLSCLLVGLGPDVWDALGVAVLEVLAMARPMAG
jgi:hypothetical protein